MTDVSDYKDLFLQAAEKHIKELMALLNALKTDSQNIALLKELHRSAHSLKGEAYIMQYAKLGDYVTVLEHYLKQLLEQQQEIPASMFVSLFEAVNAIENSLRAIEKSQEPENLPAETENLQKKLGIQI